jgi:ribonuclease-3
MSQHRKQQALTSLCPKLGVTFTDIALLQQALTHTSYANERKAENVLHNERLEFLGDAVLDLIVSEYLFRNFAVLPEGELTKARATVVCEPTLARRAGEIGIGEYLLLGRGEAASGGRERLSILADAFEAVIGAIYLDSGFKAAWQFVLSQLQDDLALIQRGDYVKDYKTLLQEVVQRSSESKINYTVVSESGPDHSKVFEVAVSVNSERFGTGSGKSKKEAEQNAAKQALEQIKCTDD